MACKKISAAMPLYLSSALPTIRRIPPTCELVIDEFAGNFFITKEIPPPSEGSTLILWEGDGVLKISSTISIYNSTSSTGGITVQIIGQVTNTFTVYPGNTMSYTGQLLQSNY